ncbi:lipid A deacylase LpxR family protein [Acidiphilium sp. AL]|uniref:Lipid A deacylase LpxR family protein n=1 Tax=Acidiphilium iwatense TaxID=768198 RepID=A0ABS9DRM8_9PROT|nr:MULTISPECIES: lipid A deacylase LpxR family protein [Acidiphilium]MCF3945337.1 lipid A deacylase LpxR family protein [Acidiphilium iwatense]MCU4159369.1 lipid A deacylase LpxR family protein [Acidiphilium sp. AL]
MTKNLALIACCAVPLLSLAPLTAQAGQGFPSGIWTIQDENASISTQSLTDRYYVNGLHIGWTSHRGDVPSFLAGLGHVVWGDGTQRVSIGVTQKIFTPAATQLADPPLNDEPYAGYLAATLGLIQDTSTTRSVLAVSAGVVGRDAGAEIVQNGFHSVIGQNGTHGWAHQLPSEPAFDILVSRTWRVPLGRFGNGIEADALPQLSGMIGTTEIYAQPAVTFRIGEGLNSDFGTPLLRPGPSGSDAYRPTRPFVWYVFGGIAGKLVGHDEFLQGADFQTSRSVDPYRAVGQIEAGVAIIWRGLRFSYTQVFQTRRFHGQIGGIHEYGSLAVSARF